VLLLVTLAGCTVERTAGPQASEQPTSQRSEFTPHEDNQDPAKKIDGVTVTEYEGAQHALPGQRVAYTKAPPDGGRHDQVWANCNGAVYGAPVRDEQMVHALEHGAVWIAYSDSDITGDELDALVDRVADQPFMMLSPHPGLMTPISLQAWGHQLKLDDPDDPRIDQFIEALRENPYTSPEPGARCDSEGTGFDPANPPAFEPGPPGPDAAPVN
jgi:hypothetical protein